MSRHIVTGIDIGTFETKVIIAETISDRGTPTPKIIGTGLSETRGLEHGYITNSAEATHAVVSALAKAEKLAGVKAKRAFVSFGGIGLGSLVSTGSVAITRADLEVTERDIATALESAEANISHAQSLNKKIINTIPIEYKIDGKVAWGEPKGLRAQKLEVKALFITCLEHHLTDLIKAVEGAGVEVVDIVAAPVAASFVTVSKKHRRVGCLLADIGAETCSIMAFENNNPVSLEVFPIGGADITNDLALGLKVTLDEAENIKLGGLLRSQFSKKKIDDIISSRLGDAFDHIQEHLKKIGRDSLLPAGILLTGGTASIQGIKNMAESALKLPAQIAEIHFGNSEKSRIKDNIWAVSCGLVLLGFNSESENGFMNTRKDALSGLDGQTIFKKISRWISQLLP